MGSNCEYGDFVLVLEMIFNLGQALGAFQRGITPVLDGIVKPVTWLPLEIICVYIYTFKSA